MKIHIRTRKDNSIIRSVNVTGKTLIAIEGMIRLLQKGKLEHDQYIDESEFTEFLNNGKETSK